MIKYAVHDVLAVTFLSRPIMENWTFNMIETRNMKEVVVAFEPIELPQLQTTIKKKKKNNINVQKLAKIFAAVDSDVEPISPDEEIYLHQIIQHDDDKPADENYSSTAGGIYQVAAGEEDGDNMGLELATITTANEINNELIKSTNEDLIDISDDELIGDGHAAENRREAEGTVDIVQLVPDSTKQQQQQPLQRRKTIRSTEAQKKHNKKRNNHLRLFRYQHVLKRSYYYRFRLKLILKILRHYGISFRHVKLKDDQVVVGVKNDQHRQQYEDALPSYCFDRKNYWRFKK
ncbi:hypothetical protein I4U23_027518 [Adineta vaga]|nr:hypothetical protein I4U23_027518 [Adineta vaga]